MERRCPATWLIAAFTVLACIVGLSAADRPAHVITPEGSPIWLDPQETLVFDTPLLSVMVRNEHSHAVNYALRLWVFGESGQLKGMQDSCTYDVIGGHSRVRIAVPITIAGATLRDSIVVSVTAAASREAGWSVREDAPAQLEAALAASRNSIARLTFAREADKPGEWNCPSTALR